jgi:hypothetical protein
MKNKQLSWSFAHNPQVKERRIARSMDLANKLQRQLPEMPDVDVRLHVCSRALDQKGIDGVIEVRDGTNRVLIDGSFYQMKEPRLVRGERPESGIEGYAFDEFRKGVPAAGDPNASVDDVVLPQVFLLVTEPRRSNKMDPCDVGVCLAVDIVPEKSIVQELVAWTGFVRAEKCARLSAILDLVVEDGHRRTWAEAVREVLRRPQPLRKVGT